MTRSGVWGLQDVRDKYLQSEWVQYQNLYIWGGGPNGVPGLNNTVRHSSPIQLPGQWNMALVDASSMYSSMGVKIISNNNDDFDIYGKRNGGASSTTASNVEVHIIPLNGETVPFNNTVNYI